MKDNKILGENILKDIDPFEIEIIDLGDHKEYEINIDGDIGEAFLYRRHLKILRDAGYNDKITFHISSYGGLLDTAIALAKAITETKAQTIADVVTACSAATLISLACDKIIMEPLGTFMVHNFSAAQEGKGQELKSKTEFDTRSFKLISEAFYHRIMSSAEIRRMRNDKDFWFTGEEFIKRLEKYSPEE